MNLYAHQQKIIKEDPLQCGLWLGTGSGKTRIALLLARGSTLVVAPKTQVEDKNWEREYLSLATMDMSNGSEEATWKLNDVDLTVISKETFRRDAHLLPRFDTVIVDETHTCLGVRPNTRQVNRKAVPDASQLYEALQTYLKRTKPTRLYLCTASIMKSPFTVWAAGTLLGKKWDFYKFRDTFYIPLPMPGRPVYAPRRDSKLKDKLAKLAQSIGYVGRLEDYFDVPEQTFITKHIELTSKQVNRIKALRLEYPDPIVRIGKIHQVENGVLAGDEFNEPEMFDNGKEEAILEYALQFPRMVVFAKYTAQIAKIGRLLMEEGYQVRTLEGGTKDRGRMLAEANAMKECIFIVQAQISAGWQLGKTKGHPEYFDYNCMVFASRTYSLVDYTQGIGRILRADNLKKNLYINLVVKGGVDEAVDKSLANKQDFDERLYLKI